MSFLIDEIEKASSIAVGGHLRPDGDCVGSCVGLYHIVKEKWPQKDIVLYMDNVPENLEFLIRNVPIIYGPDDSVHDLFIVLDCGGIDRLDDRQVVFENAAKTINIDHHVSNDGFADINHVVAHASSTSEILCDLFEDRDINKKAAEALYTGIVHDTGVFKHSNTTPHTMEAASKLIAKDIAFGRIIDESFFSKTYKQLQIKGRCLMESIRVMEGKVIFTVVKRETMRFYDALSSDLDGIVDDLRTTEGVEVAILLTETDTVEYKVSMRSNNIVDVSKIAKYFGGGGHIRAAGCSIKGSAFDVVNNLTGHIERQLLDSEN